MPAPAKPTFATSLTLNLYAASMALPFALHIMSPRPTGFGLGVLLPDFLALCTLLIISIVLGVKTRGSGNEWLYPFGAIAAVVLFFLSAKPIMQAIDYLTFKRKQSHLTVLALNPNNSQQLAAAGIMHVETAQPGVTLFVEDGEASDRYWGVAYSAADEMPDNSYLPHAVYYWQHLDGHWYKWARHD